MDRQQEIDFSARGHQLRILREVVFSPHRFANGSSVSASAIKAALRAIDDHGGGRLTWVSLATIARETGLSYGTAKRAVAALVEQSALAVELRHQHGKTLNHYSVVWGELDKIRKAGPMAHHAPSGEGAMAQNQGGDGSIQGGAMAHHAPQSASEAHIEPPAEDAWAAAAAELGLFLSAGRAICREAQQAGETPESLLARFRRGKATIEHPANRRLLQNPKRALAWHLRNGGWPADGLVEPQDTARDWSRELYGLVRAARRIQNRDLRERYVVDGLARLGCPAETIEAFGYGAVT